MFLCVRTVPIHHPVVFCNIEATRGNGSFLFATIFGVKIRYLLICFVSNASPDALPEFVARKGFRHIAKCLL